MRPDKVTFEGHESNDGDIISMVLIKMDWAYRRARIIYPLQSSRDWRHYLFK